MPPRSTRRTKGDGALYQRADGRWCAAVDLGWTSEGKRRRKVVTARTQAECLAKLREVRRTVETHGAVPTSSLTVSQWLDRWMREIVAKRVKPKTFDGYRHKVALIDQSIGRVRLDRLTPAHVRQMQEHAADSRSGTTALHCHRLLSKALDDAMREGVLLRNVAGLTDAPSADSPDAEALTGDQAQRLLRSLDGDPLAARWLLALLYGLRQGEVLGLRWDAVDYWARTLDVSWQLQRLTWRHGCDGKCGQRRGADCPQRHHGIPAKYQAQPLEGAWVLTKPKREKSRMVPIIGLVEAALRQRQDETADWPNPYGLVFARPDGKPYDPAKDNEAWHRALTAAGLPDVPLHAARHSAATLLQSLGVEESVRMSILGHSSATVQRQYAHVDLATQATALERAGRVLGG